MINRPRHLTILFVSVLLLVGGAYQYLTDQPNEAKKPAEPFGQPKESSERVASYLAQVTYVVDGDTVKVTVDGEQETIRVIGIDAPEVAYEDIPGECGAERATDKAIDILGGKEVKVVLDPTQSEQDEYGRTLGYLTLPDGSDFGETLLESGHAREFTFQTAYQKQGLYQTVESQAREANVGLWGECF